METISKPETPSPSSSLHLPAWLTDPRLHIFIAVLYMYRALVFITGGSGILLENNISPIGSDFVNMWTAAKCALSGNTLQIFDRFYFHQIQEILIGDVFSHHFWSYPPHLILFLLPFGFLPYLTSFLVWVLLGFALYWAALKNYIPAPRLLFGLLALAPSTFENIGSGQNGFFTAACLLAGVHFMERRPVLAGVILSLLSMKPQFAVLVPFALLGAKSWKTIATTVLATLLLLGLSVLALGTEPWQIFFEKTLPFQKLMLDTPNADDPFYSMVPSPYVASFFLGLPLTWGRIIQFVFSIGCAWAVFMTFRRTSCPRLRFAVLGGCAILATPFVLTYDMTTLTAAVLCLASLKETSKASIPTQILLATTWLLPLLIIPFNHGIFPVGPFVITAFVALALHQVRATV